MYSQLSQLKSGILSDKTMDNKFIYILNNYKQNEILCGLNVFVEKFEPSIFKKFLKVFKPKG